jgi:hypothetical protein
MLLEYSLYQSLNPDIFYIRFILLKLKLNFNLFEIYLKLKKLDVASNQCVVVFDWRGVARYPRHWRRDSK